ncbi:hypothetical protein SAMN05877753_1201, partial [Bacillus oleivorans]
MNYTEQLEKLISEVLDKYAKENQLKISYNSNYYK